MARAKETVEKAVERNIPRLSKILVALSGGIDSCSLLHAIFAQAKRKRLLIEVAHLDHGLRSKSFKDAQFVQRLCDKHGLTLHLKRVKRPEVGLNVEAWGREQRYGWFSELLKLRNLDFVVTAHNANDVAETFLMRLVSNKELRSIQRVDPERKLRRPLLDVSRDEIENYAARHSLTWHEDKTNRDPKFLRNRVRKKLLPMLAREFDSHIVEVISLRAHALAEDLEILDSLASRGMEDILTMEFGSKTWLRSLRSFLDRVDPTLAWRSIEKLMFSELGFKLGRKHSSTLLEFLRGNGRECQLPSGLRIVRSTGTLQLRRSSRT